MSIKGLERAFWQAAGDGWINWQEAHQIERAALENDNTVNAQEKKFLQDHYRPGFSDPQANFIFERLSSWGDKTVDDEMAALRKKRDRLRMPNSDYVEEAKKVLAASTDTIEKRMAQARQVKLEARLFNSDFQELGKQVFANSRDPIYNQMEALRTFKLEAGLWSSEYKELGKQLLINSVDVREERLLAAEHFRVEGGLWQSELQEIQRQIYADTYWDPTDAA